MEGTGGRLVPAQRLVEVLHRGAGRRVAVPHDPRQPRPRRLVRRHRVHLLLLDQLQAMLHVAEEPVRSRERVGVGLVDVAGAPELLERDERRRRADGVVVAPVHELQQLHRELDVADAAAAPLDLAVAQLLARDLALGPRLHRPHGAQVVEPERPLPDPGLRDRQPPFRQFGVARRGPGLEECLELPRLGPRVPVRGVGVERPDERAVATLGP